MDGVRVYWDGSKFLSFYCQEIAVPEPFKAGLPSIPLDGMLWIGRGLNKKLIDMISTKDSDWKSVYLYIFDLPSSEERYEERMASLLKLSLPRHARVHKTEKCQSMEHVQQILESVLTAGGEGIMAREPNSK